jgi:hypothetical protein
MDAKRIEPPPAAGPLPAPVSIGAALRRRWPSFVLVVLGAVAGSGLLLPGLGAAFDVPITWRLLAIALIIPSIIGPVVALPFMLVQVRLEAEQARVRALSTLLPVCAWCRQVRVGDGDWQPLEAYVARLGGETTHAMCPACAARHFPER